MGIYKEQEEEPTIIRRMLHYDKNISLLHIKKHFNSGNNPTQCSIFSGVDINDLYERVLRALPTAVKLQKFSSNDIYLFSFARIGENRLKDCNKIQVITNKGTNEIVSMYPIESSYRFFINDSLYEDYLNDTANNVKKLSQIDKFNKRYNLK